MGAAQMWWQAATARGALQHACARTHTHTHTHTHTLTYPPPSHKHALAQRAGIWYGTQCGMGDQGGVGWSVEWGWAVHHAWVVSASSLVVCLKPGRWAPQAWWCVSGRDGGRVKPACQACALSLVVFVQPCLAGMCHSEQVLAVPDTRHTQSSLARLGIACWGLAVACMA